MSHAQSSGSAPTLTVIIPVFNEARTLEAVLQEVLQTPYEKQILIVDDGSADGTIGLLERLESAHPIDVLRHVENRGKGAAIRTALTVATGRFTIIQDADRELSPADYPRLIEPLLAGNADFVIGSRFLESRRRSLSRAGVSLLNRCVRLLYGVRLTDEACGYKALPTATLRTMNLQCERFEFCPEVVAKACRLGLRITEVPVRYHPRGTADGKKLRYRDGIDAIATLWRWRRWTPDSVQRKRHGGGEDGSTDGPNSDTPRCCAAGSNWDTA